MKILFLNPVGIVGGGERVLLTLLSALKTINPELELVLIVGSDGGLVAQSQALGVAVTVLPLPTLARQIGDSALKQADWSRRIITSVQLAWRLGLTIPTMISYLRRLHSSIRSIEPDIIHSNGIKTHVLTGLLRLNSIPVVWHIHDFYGSRPLVANVLRSLSRHVSAAIAISYAVANDVRSVLPRLPIEVIYNAVDTDYFAPSPSNLEGDRLTQTEPLRIGLVATFARWKGQDIFLDAAAHVLQQMPEANIRFYIVGGAIYETQHSQWSEPELKARAQALNITDRVEFLGFQESMLETYRWLDIVVHASTQPEPFGMVIVEAMACGKPVIVAKSGGVAELVTDGDDAIATNPGDAIALSAAIQQLLSHPKQRHWLGQNARETATQRFLAQRFGEDVYALYEGLVRAKGKGRKAVL
jgi:glycosyltransferase involved in cell wall biosynthesis